MFSATTTATNSRKQQHRKRHFLYLGVSVTLMSHLSFYSIVADLAVALRHVVSPLDWSATPPQVVSCTQRLFLHRPAPVFLCEFPAELHQSISNGWKSSPYRLVYATTFDLFSNSYTHIIIIIIALFVCLFIGERSNRVLVLILPPPSTAISARISRSILAPSPEI